jgi:DNA-binding SARP family transcriptional activator
MKTTDQVRAIVNGTFDIARPDGSTERLAPQLASPRADGTRGMRLSRGAMAATPMSRVRLGLLRDFELRCDNEIVEVPPTSQRLIGFLALHGQRQVRRSYVSGSLWPDSSGTRANASLRSAIWRCPIVDGQPLVLASYTHLWLQPDVEVDLKTAARRAQHVLALPSLDAAAIDIAADLEAFGDDVLVSWYEEWVLAERERFRQLRLHVLDKLGELLLRAHRFPEAVQFGLVAVASEPLRESAHRLLVRAHLCEGNLAEAFRQYRTYADLLARELQVRPSAAMEDLVADALVAAAEPAWRSDPRATAHIGSHATV